MQKMTLKINGMHCVGCSMNIDGALEDTKGIQSATTKYASSVCDVTYDPKLISKEKIVAIVADAGYAAQAI